MTPVVNSREFPAVDISTGQYTEFLNLLPILFLFRSFATFTIKKVWFLGAPYRICLYPMWVTY